MKKNLFLITTCCIGAIAGIITGCKKDAVSKQIPGGFIYQFGANVPVEGVTVQLYKADPNCIFCNDIFYRSVTTEANGSFEIDNQTDKIEYFKNGYFYGYGKAGSFGANSIFYINKIGWAKYHITNPDGKKIDTLLSVPYSYLAPWIIMGTDTTFLPLSSSVYLTINNQTDTIISTLVTADAENSINLQYETKDFYPTSIIVDSFYVKSNDTAHVEIKIN
ncbi:MAG TPA: hypothetical protein VFU62_12140 [Hanamia sp.]|nr:hypothetical protein [Hanamia sp.]